MLKFFKKKEFPGTVDYWESRYKEGGNSGSGSYAHLAEFKAKILNEFVESAGVKTVIEFGCGDGNQLSMANYPNYIGMDVSGTIIQSCAKKFEKDPSKSFYLYDSRAFFDHKGVFRCDLALSLDVIYHLIEDEIFEKYMSHVFGSSNKYVIIYSNDDDKYKSFHEKNRVFTQWVEKNAPEWKLIKRVANIYPQESNSDFFFYEKNS